MARTRQLNERCSEILGEGECLSGCNPRGRGRGCVLVCVQRRRVSFEQAVLAVWQCELEQHPGQQLQPCAKRVLQTHTPIYWG